MVKSLQQLARQFKKLAQMKEQDRPYFESLWGPFSKKETIPLQRDLQKKVEEPKKEPQKIPETIKQEPIKSNEPMKAGLYKELYNKVEKELKARGYPGINDAYVLQRILHNTTAQNQIFHISNKGIEIYTDNNTRASDLYMVIKTLQSVGFHNIRNTNTSAGQPKIILISPDKPGEELSVWIDPKGKFIRMSFRDMDDE